MLIQVRNVASYLIICYYKYFSHDFLRYAMTQKLHFKINGIIFKSQFICTIILNRGEQQRDCTLNHVTWILIYILNNVVLTAQAIQSLLEGNSEKPPWPIIKFEIPGWAEEKHESISQGMWI
jgi:hypothetical protein